MSGSLFDPRLLSQLPPGAAERMKSMTPALGAQYASMLGVAPSSASAGPVAPGTPYTGPAPYVAGAYNTLSPSDYAAYQASLQPAGPGGVAAPQLPGLLDDADTQRQIEQAKKLFDNPNGYWSGGEGGGGNGGGQR